MTQETGNFRGRIFGGFDRSDVIGYIEELAAERNELQKDNERLRECIEGLENKLSEVQEDNHGLPEPLQEQSEAAVSQSRKELSELIENAELVLNGIRRQYDAVCADIKINVTQAECELSRLSGHASGLEKSMKAAGERLDGIVESINEIRNNIFGKEEQ
ncbi:MAG: DivIVA domain-containing protein [Oscillospiraceae bacterium]